MTTLGDMLRTNAQVHGERIAIREDAGCLTWRAYVDRIARTARALRQVGLRPGDRFGVLARTSVQQAQLLNAGYWSGIVPVPLNFRLAVSEIADLAADARVGHLFVDGRMAALLDEAPLSGWRGRATRLDLDGPGEGGDAFAARVAAADPLDPHDVREDDDALLLYTGGTTGRGKGVRLSHRNIVTNALQLARVMRVGADDVYLHVAPMFHSTDLKSTVVSLFGGGHVYVTEFTPDGVLRAAGRHGVTILSLVPVMIARMLGDARPHDRPVPTLRLISYGSSPMDEGVLRRAMAAFSGVDFQQCYGLTEASPFVSVLDEAAHSAGLDGRPDLLRTAGRPLPLTQVRFVDASGRDVAPGQDGEIVVRGPQLAKGYLDRPEEQADSWRDGWFHTGDVGRLRPDGLLQILGRQKEMVITGGENVYTREVEEVLARHPGVTEAAVVGVPDPLYGEALLAVVVAGAPAPSADDLIAFCRDHLGGFKIPRRYRFVADLPRTTVGKVSKRELSERYGRADALA